MDNRPAASSSDASVSLSIAVRERLHVFSVEAMHELMQRFSLTNLQEFFFLPTELLQLHDALTLIKAGILHFERSEMDGEKRRLNILFRLAPKDAHPEMGTGHRCR